MENDFEAIRSALIAQHRSEREGTDLEIKLAAVNIVERLAADLYRVSQSLKVIAQVLDKMEVSR